MLFLFFGALMMCALCAGLYIGQGELVKAIESKDLLRQEIVELKEDIVIHLENQEKFYEEITRLNNVIANQAKRIR